MQLGGISLKLSPLIGVTTLAFVLEAWHINSAHAPLNRDGGGLLPDAYLHLVRKKGQLLNERIKDLLLQRLDHL